MIGRSRKNEAKIDKLEKQIEDAEKQKAEALEGIEEVLDEIKDMEEERVQENDDFKTAKKDDEDAIKLIEEARDALAKFYKENAPKLIQEPKFKKPADQPPEFKLSSDKHRKGQAMGVVELMGLLISDLETEIKNGIKAEEKAQLDFEDRMEKAKDLEKELRKTVTNLDGQIADNKSDKIDEEGDKEDNEGDLTTVHDDKEAIKPDCDWIIANFNERDEKREAEMNGLVEAKQFLAGAQALLQTVSPHRQLRGSA